MVVFLLFMRSVSLALQVAHSRSDLQALGSKVNIIQILGAIEMGLILLMSQS